MVLVDELVAYIRQLPNGQTLSGGSYDSNLSFVQALTEAIKLVLNAILLASLPESDIEAGSNRGMTVLQALEKTFGRLQALCGSQSRPKRRSRSSDDDSSNQFEMSLPVTLYAEPLLTPT